MTKFVGYFDFASGYEWKYIDLEAQSLEEAIEEMDKMTYGVEEQYYLVRIMKKVGKTERIEGAKVSEFEAVMCKRKAGWHRNTVANSENEHRALRYETKYSVWHECKA